LFHLFVEGEKVNYGQITVAIIVAIEKGELLLAELSVMTSGSCAPRAWWKRSLIPAAPAFSTWLCYQICLVFLKLYEKIYAPLTAVILQPFPADRSIPKDKITALDHRYTAVIQAPSISSRLSV